MAKTQRIMMAYWIITSIGGIPYATWLMSKEGLLYNLLALVWYAIASSSIVLMVVHSPDLLKDLRNAWNKRRDKHDNNS